ncbi:MAG: tRNA (guanosine(46)-N7)-methyltransferase TrmB [Acidimicrobiales bacterium]|nr:tRNA (guanosine(46)-N7)-methyltransferase TrmB [Acidimicrobiales bacterium]MCB1247337.1 tRNA (guanosine(46)-N7)-methyltransferase TrmB [Acidimicrobiia bacterium]
MTAARLAVLDDLGDRWMLETERFTCEAIEASFERTAPLMLDVGVGNGLATRAWAAEHPDRDVVAVELHRPGISRLIKDLDENGPGNVRVVDGDVTTLIDDLGPSTLAEVRILFPDPWPKRRHHKRRLVDPTFVGAVTDRLTVGGHLHLATDWLDYADAMRSALDTEPRLETVVDHDDGPAVDAEGRALEMPTRWRTNRPSRPVTAYEQRGIDAGRTITDLLTRRTR